MCNKYIRIVPTLGVRILHDFLHKFKKRAKHPERYPWEERWGVAQKTLRALNRSFHMDIRVEGFENYENLVKDDKRALIVANHTSFLDPLILMSFINEPLLLVGKKEVEEMPFVGVAFKSIDGVFMDREDLKQSLKIILQCSSYLKEKKSSVLIFPEGTRNKDPENTLPADYHAGTFKAATRVGAPVLPIAMWGNFRGLTTKPDYKSLPIHIVFGKPITQEEYKDLSSEELAEKVRTWTVSQIERLKEADKKYFEMGEHKIPLRKRKRDVFVRYDFNEMKEIG